MSARILYTQAGDDPATIVWPPHGHPSERWEFENGKPREVDGLFTHGDGSITAPDGREFPRETPEGSTFALVDSLEAEPSAPTVSGVSPSSASLPSAAVRVKGSGFTEASVIVFGGVDMDTAFTDEATLVATLTAETAANYEILVRDGEVMSNVVMFEFTEPVEARGHHRHRR